MESASARARARAESLARGGVTIWRNEIVGGRVYIVARACA